MNYQTLDQSTTINLEVEDYFFIGNLFVTLIVIPLSSYFIYVQNKNMGN